MQGNVLCGKIVVIPVVGVEIFHLFLVDGHPKLRLRAAALEVAVIGGSGDIYRKSAGQGESHYQFLPPVAAHIFVGIGLYLAGFHLAVKEVVIGQDGQNLQHPPEVVGIVKKQ